MKENVLPEDNGHTIAFFEYGNPNGTPILGFHGGPGSKSKPRHADRFDLSKYRVILFDQRGCGKSTPLGKLEHNTTEEILNDAERIRKQLGIEKWFVAGSSWGSTCSLLYSIKYPERVRGVLISAVFLGDRDSVSWSMEDSKGVARLVPDVWHRRIEFLRKYNISIEHQNADILNALENASYAEQQEITAGVFNWEGNLFSAQSAIAYTDPEEVTDENIASVKIFAHYEMHDSFISENNILNNTHHINHIPTVIVHGRYDILCPLEKAWLLKEKMNNCELVIATSSGHKLTAEGETIQKMAFDRFLEKTERNDR